MRIALIVGIVILTAACLYAGARLTGRLTRRRLWSALLVALVACAVLLWRQVASWPVSDIVVMLTALLLACAIGRALTSSPALIAFCITAGIVDFLSFSRGLTAKIMSGYGKGHDLLLQYLSIAAPLSNRIVPLVGIGDLVILGSIYFALHKLGRTGWLPFLFPLGGLLVALGVGLVIGGIFALPFIGGATIIYLLLWKGPFRSSPKISNPASGWSGI